VAKPRVLIVDDSKVIRSTVAKVIRSSFDTCDAADGEAGWAALEHDPAYVVVFSAQSLRFGRL
jgi:two-component system, cell cycle response regulator